MDRARVHVHGVHVLLVSMSTSRKTEREAENGNRGLLSI